MLINQPITNTWSILVTSYVRFDVPLCEQSNCDDDVTLYCQFTVIVTVAGWQFDNVKTTY